MDEYQPQLGELIRDLRAEHGFGSQDDLAEAAGVDVRTLRALECGGKVQAIKLAKICNPLKISIQTLKDRAVAMRQPQGGEVKKGQLSTSEGTGVDSSTAISQELDRIDADIKNIYGKLTAPTREDGITHFSARRLVSSLSTLGIPPEVIFKLLARLTRALRQHVPNKEILSTSHIRSAVAQLISEFSVEDISDTNAFRFRREISPEVDAAHQDELLSVEEIKFDWASRYARRYGNPTQIMQILEENGKSRRLDYAFIKGELIPHVLRRVLGDDFSVADGQLVNPTVVSEMARTALEEFRRLGLYTMRYRTALWLTEDLAIHPPHPWMVSNSTRETTISYDFERAEANLGGLRGEVKLSSFGAKHRFSEVAHHLCSAILATYSGFLGHKYTSSLHMLRHWLAIKNDNPVLWRSCDLQLIDSDLFACGISRQDFSSLLKKIDAILGFRVTPPSEDLITKCDKLKLIALSLHKQRSKMIDYELSMSKYSDDITKHFPNIASEIIFSCFGARKIHDLIDRSNGKLIGYNATPAFEGTVLTGRPPLFVFLFFINNDDEDHGDICERAVDQLNAHRLSETCVILCAREPSKQLKEYVKKSEATLPGSQIIRVLYIGEMRERRKNASSTSELIDSIFATSQ